MFENEEENTAGQGTCKSHTPFIYHFHLGYLILEFPDGCTIWSTFPMTDRNHLLPDSKLCNHRIASLAAAKLFIEHNIYGAGRGDSTWHPPLQTYAMLTLAEAQRVYEERKE